MNRVYFYKLTTDNGGAPHVRDGLLSLAICKPMIRRSAEPGDLILGFAANGLWDDNRLIYAARITETVRDGAYFSPAFAHRGDCIYERRGDRFVWREGADYHGPADLPHDLGDVPDYPRANVLLSSAFRYFGKTGSAEYKTRYPNIRVAVENLGRGHRVDHAAPLHAELRQLAEEVLAGPSTEPGAPSSAACRGVCLRDDEVCVVEQDRVQTHD